MKTLIITMLTLSLVMLGAMLAQSKSMDESTDESMAKTEDMSASESMQAEDMGKMSDEMKMQADDTMKKGEMMMNQTTIPSDAELRKRLTPMQYKVTRKNGTEPPFNNAYWDNHEPGIYVDIISGVPLFSSLDKYDSGTGWPSFTRPLDPERIVEKEDRSLFSVRTEIRAKLSDAHLGHVFNDGPAPTGLRYCMNSAALRFIAKDDLVKEGYAEYLRLFK